MAQILRVILVLAAATATVNAQAPTPTPTRFIPSIDNISESPRSDLPALRTFFTPDASCLSDLYVVMRTWSNPWEVPACHAATARTTYSPGLCYAGYEPAMRQLNTFEGLTETVIHCCPAGMSIDLQLGCSTSINGATTLYQPQPSVLVPSRMSTLHKTLKYVNDSNELYSTRSIRATELTVGNFYAPSLQVRFQSSDVEVASTWASILAAYGPLNDTPAVNSSVPVPEEEVSKPASTTSPTIAAIVLGALIALGALCGIVLLLLHRRRKALTRSESTSGHPVLEEQNKGMSMGRHGNFVPVEADAHRDAWELQGPDPSELPTGR